MKKKSILGVLTIMSIVALVGCGKTDKDITTTENTTIENVVTEKEIVDNTTEADYANKKFT